MSDVKDKPKSKATDIRQEINQPAAIKFDPDRYRGELDGLDLSEDQKQEFMAVLWDILCRFVELGFSVDVCSALLGDTPMIPTEDDLE